MNIFGVVTHLEMAGVVTFVVSLTVPSWAGVILLMGCAPPVAGVALLVALSTANKFCWVLSPANAVLAGLED